MRASIGNVNAEEVPGAAASAARWRTAFWVSWTVVQLAKIALAASLAPFGDEAWYWQESRHLAWGYSDLPPATAWLIALGEYVGGHGVLAMRGAFLLLGALLPLLLVRIGRRLFGEKAGWCAGLLALALPLLSTLGIFALPDVPLTFASALALDAFERAARERRLRDWIVLGVALGLAWLCHYRAAMLMLTGLAFLLLTPRGRALWRAAGLWIALALALLGVVPILLFNATHDWVALGFQLVERNPWSFHADGLLQPLEQAIVNTPLFYLLLLCAAWHCLRRRSEGAPHDLLAVCALLPIVVYFVVGCFADDTRFRVHWPLPGYLPLLLVLPLLLARATSAVQRFGRIAALAMLALGSALAFAYLAITAAGGAATLAGVKAFPEHFVGWREAASRTELQLSVADHAHRNQDQVLLVADNFMLAAELDFAFAESRKIYVLDHPINAKHGRAPQLAQWQRDEVALNRSTGQRVLLVVEPSARRERDRAAWIASLCVRVGQLVSVGSLDLYDGRKRYRWFEGVVGGENERTADGGCTIAVR
jgi:4-amino-4-deoxy-L-arabinose transferase-like glycosyltransferase